MAGPSRSVVPTAVKAKDTSSVDIYLWLDHLNTISDFIANVYKNGAEDNTEFENLHQELGYIATQAADHKSKSTERAADRASFPGAWDKSFWFQGRFFRNIQNFQDLAQKYNLRGHEEDPSNDEEKSPLRRLDNIVYPSILLWRGDIKEIKHIDIRLQQDAKSQIKNLRAYANQIATPLRDLPPSS